MSEKGVLREVCIETLVHVTEDLEKVKEALLNIIPSPYRDRVRVLSEVVYGYHDNPIIILRVMVKEAELLKAFLKELSERMYGEDKALLARTLGLRVAKSKDLYLRLDKQRLVHGELRLSDGDDVIKLRLTFMPLKGGRVSIVEACREAGLI